MQGGDDVSKYHNPGLVELAEKADHHEWHVKIWASRKADFHKSFFPLDLLA